jgi:hypothetical protein
VWPTQTSSLIYGHYYYIEPKQTVRKFESQKKLQSKGKQSSSVTWIGGTIFIIKIDLFWYNSLGSSHKTLQTETVPL